MAKRIPINPKQIRIIQPLCKLLPMLGELHDAGCERDTAGNRQLHFDQYVTLVLLMLLNPLIDSMRGLQEAAGLEKVARKLGVKRFSLGSFSESVARFDPEKLKAVVQQFADGLNPIPLDPRLADFPQILTAVDGTVIDAIAQVAEAWWLDFQDHTPKYAWRLHTQFELRHWIPADFELSDARGSGKSDEKKVLRKKLAADHCYILDRLYGQFVLFNEINAIASSYVCRMKENSTFEVLDERLLSQEALDAEIVRDVVVRMGLSSKPQEKPDHPIRLIVIQAQPHEKRGGRKGKTAGPRNAGTIVIATNLLLVPARIIALIYQYRYSVELFFRFLKQMLGCRHLLSQRREGVQIQMYCALLACMLINLWTGRKPTKRMVEMLGYYCMGVASEQEVRAFLTRPDNRGVKLRAKDELWKKLGY